MPPVLSSNGRRKMAIILTIAQSRQQFPLFAPETPSACLGKGAGGDVVVRRQPLTALSSASAYVGSEVTLETVISGRKDPNSGATTALKMSVEI